ncbi:hypothetical protein CB0940_11600 [Cercospora beticola]|uniref:Uncharacterized protein n=1 Tax=Cercospora beticola TaxID=122368 RepID=A0A2G5IEL3_CERBT|nr:hypothetical protein CB0940_11600 [Cercospora beticola]PIB02954.1 hypothetical protein CB0940_11600 [Cercospora beticola]WPB03943.1 hypothetical protein RHO25_008587 [Cercospora beticola]CAK1357269.1 unnamed protein product [Cercospora beticola]
MSGPGTIQTVYTTSKKGKRERLGEWFLRSAQRSHSKRGILTNGATDGITTQAAQSDTSTQSIDNGAIHSNGNTPGPTDNLAQDQTRRDRATSAPQIQTDHRHIQFSVLNDIVERESRSSGDGGSSPIQRPPSRVSSRLFVAEDFAEASEIEELLYWGPTRDIAAEKLVKLLDKIGKKSKEAADTNYKLISKHCGSYNCAYILESNFKERTCIRVPAYGFPGRWNDFDAKLLRESALGMKYIRDKTDLPIPRLLSYDLSLDNEIGAPFIAMSYLGGRPVEEVWPQREGEDFSDTDARRHHILHSLANTMPLLESAVFSRYGALHFDKDDSEPTVGDTSRLTTDDIFVLQRKFKPVPFRSSLEDYVHAAKRKRFDEYNYPHDNDDPFIKGLFLLWELFCERFLDVVKVEPGEPGFVLMQSDFNPQNILVDDRGNVTGLIDWDCLEAIPRQIGWSSVPHFMRKDWEPEYVWPTPEGSRQLLQPHEFDKYRKAYSRYICEACPGSNDSRFTSKSHIYAALLRSGEHIDNVKRFVSNVLGDILPRLGGVQDEFISHIGEHGYRKDQKEWLDTRLREFLAPDGC